MILKLKNMVQTSEMSHQEKVEIYRFLDKEQLIEMLIESNNMIKKLISKAQIYETNK